MGKKMKDWLKFAMARALMNAAGCSVCEIIIKVVSFQTIIVLFQIWICRKIVVTLQCDSELNKLFV